MAVDDLKNWANYEEVIMLRIPKEIKDLINDPKSIKVVVTKDEDAVPHAVIKGSLMVLDDGRLAFVELVNYSRTYRNIMRLMNSDEKKRLVSILVYRPDDMSCYQIKGEPIRIENEGPIFDMFLDIIWGIMPDADPVLVCVIEPTELMNEGYEARLEEEERRTFPLSSQWNRYVIRK